MSLIGERWTLTKRKWKIAGGIKLTLNDKNGVIELMTQDLPNWDSQLYTVPHLTRVRRKDLFSELDVTYDSEVAQVYHCFCGVSNFTGIAFHSFTNKHAKKTIEGLKKDFEIDWIFVNSSGVFVIEVGFAKDPNKSQNIISEKVEQITTRSKQIVASVLNAAEMELLIEKDVQLIVALPNTPLSELRKWIEFDVNQKTANAESLLFFTKETLTTKSLIYLDDSRWTEINVESLFQHPSTHQTELKYLSGLFFIGHRGILKPDTSPYSTKQRKFVDRKNELGDFLEDVELPDNIVLTSEQYNCVRDIVLGDAKYFQVVGEPGTGKSTVLLLLLVYYAGKKQKDEHKKFCYFSIPESKWGFYEFVLDFVEKVCDEDFVHVSSGFSDSQKLLLQKGKEENRVFLIDELDNGEKYLMANTGMLYFNRSQKTVSTLVSSGQPVEHQFSKWYHNYFDSRDTYTFFMRKWLRNSLHIATVAAKIKRTLALRSREYVTLFDSARPSNFFFAGNSQYQVTVEKIDKELKLHQDLIISYQKSYQTSFSPPRKSSVIYRTQEKNGSVQNWNFTGIEALSVAVLIDIPELPTGEELNTLLLFLYSAITRARTDAVVYCSSPVLNSVKRILELDCTDNALSLLQSGRSLSWDELQRCWPNDERQVAFMLLSIHRSDFNLTEQLISLILRNPAVVFSTFGLEHILSDVDAVKKKSLRALFIMFALLNPKKSLDVHEYIKKLCEGLSGNPLTCLANNKCIQEFSHKINSWNSSNELLEKYEHLVPFNVENRLSSPILTALWFTGEDRIAECYSNSWNLQHILHISKLLCLVQRLSVVPTLISRLQDLLARNDEEARNFESSGEFFQVVLNLTYSFARYNHFSWLGPMIEIFPNCLKCRDSEQGTVVHHAAYLPDPSLFKIISQDNLFLFDCINRTPLDVAFLSKSDEIVKYIFDSYLDSYLEQGEPQKYPFSVILSGLGDIDRLKQLLVGRPDLIYATEKERPNLNCFQMACKHGQTEVVQFLLTLNDGAIASVDYPCEQNPLVLACLSGSIQVLKMLMPKYVKRSSFNSHIIISYAFISVPLAPNKKSAVEMCDYFVQCDCSDLISEESVQQTVFSAAFFCRNDALIDFLAAHLEGRGAVSGCAKAFIQASRERSGKEPHQIGGLYNYPSFDNLFVSILLDVIQFRGVGLFIFWWQKFQDKIDESSRRNFLMAACERGYLELVRFFSLYHPNLFMPSANNDDETSFLKIARRNGRTEVVSYLVKHHPALLIQVYSKFFDAAVDRK